MDLELPKSEIKMDLDPFGRIGFGLVAFFDLLRVLILILSLITVFFIAHLSMYSSYDASLASGYSKYWINQFGLGNMGGAST